MRYFILYLFLLLPHFASGQSAGQIGRIGFGGRGIAVGNALAGDASGSASPFYNPALAPYILKQSIGLSAALMTHDRQLQFVEFQTPLKPIAGIATGLIHAGVGQIDQRNSSGYHLGMASTNEYAFYAAFGVRIRDRASVGIGLQLFRNDLHVDLPSTQTLGIDVGIGIHVLRSLHIGMVVDDLLAKYDWDSLDREGQGATDDFPTRLRFGVSWIVLEQRLQLLAEYESRFSQRSIEEPIVVFSAGGPQQVYSTRELTLHKSHIRFGAEFTLVPALILRAGLSQLEATADGGPRPSFGFMTEQSLGLLVTQASYTFVLEPYVRGGIHMLTLRFFL